MKSKLRDLIEDVRREERLPDILGERCVHAIIETASCRACVDSCPKNAWLLDDDALGLDMDACDGCGLCAAACPERAIYTHHEIAIGQLQDVSIALCACEFSESVEPEGRVSCIHAIGMVDILRLYQKGVHHWAVLTADCNDCLRGQATPLTERLEALNRSFKSSGLVEVSFNDLSIKKWQRLYERLGGMTAGPQLSRRGFLSGLVNSGVRKGLERFDLCNDPQDSITPPGRLLPRSATTLWPYLPEIDSQSCNGCDACARLCPHAAIDLQKADGQIGYRLNPQNCTGCGICVDACDQQAVILSEWKPQVQQELVLADFKCTCCGNPMHIPAEPSVKKDILCRICIQKNHYKNLYQVLN